MVAVVGGSVVAAVVGGSVVAAVVGGSVVAGSENHYSNADKHLIHHHITIQYRVSRYIRPPLHPPQPIWALVHIENCMFPGPYTNSRLSYKFSDL